MMVVTVTDVENVEGFLEKYYKRARYHGRGAEYAASLLESHQTYFKRFGYDLISRHDSNQGEAVWFGTPEWRKDAKYFKVIYSGNTPDIGRTGRAIRYLGWGGYVLELSNGNIVTLGLGDLEELDMDDWEKRDAI